MSTLLFLDDVANVIALPRREAAAEEAAEEKVLPFSHRGQMLSRRTEPVTRLEWQP